MSLDVYISAFHPKALNVCFDLAGLLARQTTEHLPADFV